MVDLIARTPRLPTAGETLVGTAFQIGFGGKGSNQAVMSARLGADVSVVVRLGRDVFGEQTLENYRANGIDTTFVSFDDTRFSGVAPITVEDSGQNSIIVVPGANDSLLTEQVQAASETIAQADIVMCQLETPLESTLEAFKIARKANTMTILNPAPAAQLPDELLQLTDLLVPNEVEAGMLIGETIASVEQAKKAANKLLNQGPRSIILTLGAKGAVFIRQGDDEAMHVTTQEVKAVDTTGAGDAFVGSLAYFLGRGTEMQQAIHYACLIATQSVLKNGTQTSFPTREALADFDLP